MLVFDTLHLISIYSLCYEGEICVFTELGWMDEDMNSDVELIQADIETLHNEIAEALSGDEYDQCVAKAEEKMASMAPE